MDYLKEHYNHYNEDGRLVSRRGSVEYLTSMRYIHRYLPAGSSVLDVGAGTGRYSIALAREGFDVTALELMEHHIEIFASHLTESDHIRLEQGNALDLSRFPGRTFDGVLLFGPLYHLYSHKDKLQVLREAKRVVKDDGVLFVAYCLNEATMIQWAFQGDGGNMLETLANHKFGENYQCLSTPEDIFEIVRLENIDRLNRDSGLVRQEIIATDLFTHYIGDRMDYWSEEVFQRYLDYHFAICSRMDLIGATNHALDILKK